MSSLAEYQKRMREVHENLTVLSPEDEADRAAALERIATLEARMEQTEKNASSGAMRLAANSGAEAINKKMQEAGIGGGDSPKGREFVSHTGEKAFFLNKSDKVAALNGGQRLANGTGEMIRAMICGIGPRTPHEVKAAMTGGNNSLGGLLVPNYLSGDVIDLMRARAVLGAAGCPTIVLESSDNTIAKVVGEVTVQTKGELEAFTPSDIELTGVGLFPHTVGCLIESSRELAEDSPNFTQVVEDQISKTLAKIVDCYGINGFGGGSLGLMGSDITATTSIGAIAWGDISAAVTRLRVNNQEPNGSIMYPTIHDALFNQSTGNGTTAALGWLEPPPSIRDKQYWNTTNCPSTKVIVGDFTKYAMGLRTGLQIEVTTTGGDMFKKHGVSIKATIRCDWVALDNAAFERLEDVTAS